MESREKSSTGKQSKAIDSLAILPLENASGDPDTEYLSEGVAETLINTLARLRKIRVLPRSLAFGYRGPGVKPLEVGRELGVRAVLAGRLLQRGDDLTVSVELVDVDRQAQLWGGRYNRKMTDLLALQEELATEISEKLRLQLTGEEKKKLRKRATQNNEVFRLLLEARHAVLILSPEAVRKAIALAQRAIEKDPTYAPAYAGLSDALSTQAFMGYAAPLEVSPLAKRAAQKALELDDTLAEAHVSLGFNLMYLDWEFPGAEKEVRRGLELHPDLGFAYLILSEVDLICGRFEDAINTGKRYIDLEPFSAMAETNLGIVYLSARRFGEAIGHLRKALELDPSHSTSRVLLALAYATAGQRENAIEKCQEAMAVDGRTPIIRLHAAAAYAKADKAEEARRILEDAEKDWKPDGTSSCWIGAVHACLGEKDAAFEWLEKAFNERVGFMAFLKFHPLFFDLHGDPRLAALVKRIGIPD